MCLHSLVKKRGKGLGEFESRSVKTRDAVESFQLLESSLKLCLGFHQAIKAERKCFVSFIKLNKEKDNKQSAYVFKYVFILSYLFNSHNQSFL